MHALLFVLTACHADPADTPDAIPFDPPDTAAIAPGDPTLDAEVAPPLRDTSALAPRRRAP